MDKNMNEIKRINDDMVEIDGMKYARVFEAEFEKPKWPTSVTTLHQCDGEVLKFSPLVRPDTSKAIHILKCIAAARAINGDWKPDWEDDDDNKVYPSLDSVSGSIETRVDGGKNYRDLSFVWFPTEEECQHFIDHFGDIWLEAIG